MEVYFNPSPVRYHAVLFLDKNSFHFHLYSDDPQIKSTIGEKYALLLLKTQLTDIFAEVGISLLQSYTAASN
jgi:hypothetical protein